MPTYSERARQRVFRLPPPTARTAIRQTLRGVPKAIAACFYQLLSGHAMTAVLLKREAGADGFGPVLVV